MTYKYDSENRLVKVSDGSGYVARFGYDGKGARAKRVDSNGTIIYVGGHYERNVGNGADPTATVSKFYYAALGAASRLVAMRKGGTLYYVCSDHLGVRRGSPTRTARRLDRAADSRRLALIVNHRRTQIHTNYGHD